MTNFHKKVVCNYMGEYIKGIKNSQVNKFLTIEILKLEINNTINNDEIF